MKIFAIILFALSAVSLHAQLLPGDAIKDDSIPRTFTVIGLQKFQNVDGIQSSLLTFSAATYNTFFKTRKFHVGIAFTSGGLNTGLQMEGLACITPSVRYTFYGSGDFGVFVSGEAGIAQTFTNPFSNLGDFRFAHTGWGASGWGGTYVRLFHWLPPVELSVGYWYMNLEKNYTFPAAKIGLIF
ncbi:MAG: hypothetical protein V4642_09830 [Bacteroidota bacterium]